MSRDEAMKLIEGEEPCRVRTGSRWFAGNMKIVKLACEKALALRGKAWPTGRYGHQRGWIG